MKRINTIVAALLLLCNGLSAQKGGSRNYIVGFYNLENLFDIYNDPAKNDEEFLPDGKNKWTEEKYQKKVRNMYLKQCESDPKFIRIDCSDEMGRMLPPDDIFLKIKDVVDAVLKS